MSKTKTALQRKSKVKTPNPIPAEIVDPDDVRGPDGEDPDGDDDEAATAPTPKNRVRASMLRAQRKRGAALAAEDAAWLADYDLARADAADARRIRGASKSRKISYTEEEAEAEGEGSEEVAMAGAAAMSREEGRRYDSLLSVGITCLREANSTYRQVAEHLLARNRELESAHVAMMRAFAGEFRGRVSAESEIERLQKLGEEGGKDGIAQLADMILPLVVQSLNPPAETGAAPAKTGG